MKSMKKTGVLIIFVCITSTSTERMNEVKLKNQALVTTLATVEPAGPIPYIFSLFQGYGQIYNGQYLKRAGFCLHSVVSGFLLVNGSDVIATLGVGMLIGGYVLSIIDANLSAKKINQQRLKSGLSKVNSTTTANINQLL